MTGDEIPPAVSGGTFVEKAGAAAGKACDHQGRWETERVAAKSNANLLWQVCRRFSYIEKTIRENALGAPIVAVDVIEPMGYEAARRRKVCTGKDREEIMRQRSMLGHIRTYRPDHKGWWGSKCGGSASHLGHGYWAGRPYDTNNSAAIIFQRGAQGYSRLSKRADPLAAAVNEPSEAGVAASQQASTHSHAARRQFPFPLTRKERAKRKLASPHAFPRMRLSQIEKERLYPVWHCCGQPPRERRRLTGMVGLGDRKKQRCWARPGQQLQSGKQQRPQTDWMD